MRNSTETCVTTTSLSVAGSSKHGYKWLSLSYVHSNDTRTEWSSKVGFTGEVDGTTCQMYKIITLLNVQLISQVVMALQTFLQSLNLFPTFVMLCNHF